MRISKFCMFYIIKKGFLRIFASCSDAKSTLKMSDWGLGTFNGHFFIDQTVLLVPCTMSYKSSLNQCTVQDNKQKGISAERQVDCLRRMRNKIKRSLSFSLIEITFLSSVVFLRL